MIQVQSKIRLRLGLESPVA